MYVALQELATVLRLILIMYLESVFLLGAIEILVTNRLALWKVWCVYGVNLRDYT